MYSVLSDSFARADAGNAVAYIWMRCGLNIRGIVYVETFVFSHVFLFTLS